MKRFRQRKAFTIVEMVIVIAVIAILATVLVPTISGVIQKANHSADQQFVASLNVQLALWDVDHDILSESDLRDAINYYYGDWEDEAKTQLKADGDFYAKLSPKSAAQGYHYWWDAANKMVVLDTLDGLKDTNDDGEIAAAHNSGIALLAVGDENEGDVLTFSPANPRSLVITAEDGNKYNYFLMDQAGSDVVDVIIGFENLGDDSKVGSGSSDPAQQYEYSVKKLLNSEAGTLEAALLAKVEKTTIVIGTGAYRFNDINAIEHVYIPQSATIINVQNVYEFTPSTGIVTISNTFALATHEKVPVVQIPVGVKIASNGFPAMSGDLLLEDLSNPEKYNNATVLEIMASDMSALTNAEGAFMFDIQTSNPVFKLAGSAQLYVVIEGGVYTLPYNSSDTSVEVGGNLGTGTSGNLDVSVSFPSTTLGKDAFYYDTVNKILYVQYDQTEVPITVKNGTYVNWTITEVKAEGVEPTSTLISIDKTNGLVKLNGKDASKQIRVIGKINDEEKASFIVCPVGVNSVDFGSLKGALNAIGKPGEKPIELSYDGVTKTFNFTVKVNYTAEGKVAPWDVTFASKDGKFTIAKNYVKNDEGEDVWDNTVTITLGTTYDFTDTLTITVGDVAVQYSVKCVDASGFAFEKAPMKEGSTDKVGEKYMFRVGTSGTAITLDKLFATTKSVPSVGMMIYDISEDASGKTLVGNGGIGVTVSGATEKKTMDGTVYKTRYWEMTRDNWASAELSFSGTGVVKIVIGKLDGETFTEQETMYLEVVNGKNVFSYSELGTSGNFVLWADITLNKDQHSLSNGTLFGNGYTFDVKNGGISGTGYRTENYLVKLSNANLDNIQIVGPVYNAFSLTAGNDYNRANVIASGTCGIYNSYISNAASPIRLVSGELTVVGTTLKGGSFANIDLRNGELILDDVITINQVNSNDPYLGDGTYKNKPIVGLGIVIWYETTNGSEGITVRDVNNNGTAKLQQYNYIANNQVGNCISTASSLVDVAFEQAGAAFVHTDSSNVKWLNTGILSMAANVKRENISDIDGYAWGTVSYAGQSGNLQTESVATVPGNIGKVAPTYAPFAQGFVAPSVTWNYPSKSDSADYTDTYYCDYDETTRTVMITFGKGGSFTFNPNILTASKLGEGLDVTIKMNGVDCSGGIKFTEAGEHVVEYTYTDRVNNRLSSSGVAETYNIVYTKTLKVKVAVAETEKNLAQFTFGSGNAAVAGTPTKVGDTWYVSATGYTGETGTKNGITYPIIDVKYTEDTTGSGTLKQSTSKTTIQTMFGGDTCQVTLFCPIFDSVISITDNELGTFGSGTTAMPADNRLTVFKDHNGLMSWSSGTAASTDPVEKSGNLYLRPTSASGNNRTRGTYVVEFTYQSIHGELYHYYVGYRTPQVKKDPSVCVAPDTLVTLSDGSQKEIQYVTFEDELLVWNFFTGKYDTVPASLLVYHEAAALANKIKLTFDDGTVITIMNEHGFFDADQNQFVFIDAENVENYIGHTFLKQGDGTFGAVKFVDYELTQEVTESYSILTSQYYNCFLEGLLSLTPHVIEGNFFMPFEIGAGMKYDADQVQADIERYGLYTYEDLAAYMTEETFNALDARYFKIVVEKGIVEFEDLMMVVQMFF